MLGSAAYVSVATYVPSGHTMFVTGVGAAVDVVVVVVGMDTVPPWSLIFTSAHA